MAKDGSRGAKDGAVPAPALPGVAKVADVRAQEEADRAAEAERRAVEAMPLWDMRIAELERRGATPRDLFETDILALIYPKGRRGQDLKKNVAFLWISYIIESKRPNLTGFVQDMYEKVTQEVMDRFGIDTVTKDRTPDGVPRAGHDAVLYWAPKKLVKEMDKILLAGAEPARKLKALQDEMEGKFAHQGLDGKGLIGEIKLTDSDRELSEVADEQRGGMGALPGSSGSSQFPQHAE